MNHWPPRTPEGTRWGGRQKRTPNKLTVGVKNALHAVFTEAGGVEYLVGVAKAEAREPGVSVHFLSATGCPAVLSLRRLNRLPLHVGRRVRPAERQRHNVVDDVPRPAVRIACHPLELKH